LLFNRPCRDLKTVAAIITEQMGADQLDDQPAGRFAG